MTRAPDWTVTDDEIKETFEQCPDCGQYAIYVTGTHSCTSRSNTSTGQPTSETRQHRINTDPYPLNETVVVADDKPSSAYAYHETDTDDHPLCSRIADKPLKHLTRKQAHNQQRTPCQHCRRIRQQDEGEDGVGE